MSISCFLSWSLSLHYLWYELLNEVERKNNEQHHISLFFLTEIVTNLRSHPPSREMP